MKRRLKLIVGVVDRTVTGVALASMVLAALYLRERRQ
jgi:hypothetical protein